jgi:hypothetical protein
MSDTTDGRGLVSDEFDDDEIDWDDEEPTGSDDEEDGLSPIEAMVSDSMDVVVPDEDLEPEDAEESEDDE